MKNKTWWAYNLPLQAWGPEEGNAGHILNYMPRKEACSTIELDEDLFGEQSREEFFETTAQILENLAKQMRAFGRGEVDHVYYPDTGFELSPVKNGEPK